MDKKPLIGIVICTLLIVSTIIPVSATTSSVKTSQPSTMGNTLYVGGSGPNNYTKIQDAIDDANDGYMVFVYAGIYYENITIYHVITVMGENKNTTIIDGYETDNVVYIVGNGICFSGFTVQNSSLFGGAGIMVLADGGSVEIINVHVTDNAIGILLKSGTGIILHDSVINNNIETGVYVQSYRSEIHDNIITNNRIFGIVLLDEDVDYTIIKNNVITYSREGIWISDMYQTSNIEITNNIIMNSSIYGVTLGTIDSKINGNQFYNNSIAFSLVSGQCNDIRENTFQNNNQGLWIVDTGNNRIHRNNFIQNQEDAFFTYFLFIHTARNYWYHNYWDTHHLPIPKPIKGQKVFFIPFSVWFDINWAQFDVFPALKPYDRPGMR
jgi:parallel beta-helix repeat protein